MKAKLLKRMTLEGKTLDAGEVIEVTEWKNLKTLISGRYIEVILDAAPKAEKPKVEAEAKVKLT